MLGHRTKALGPDHLDVAVTQQLLGSLQAAAGNREEALLFLNKAKAIRIKKLGPQHPDTKAVSKDIEKLTPSND